MSVLRIAGALAALLLAAASPCGAHGLQSNPAARGHQRATSVVRRAATPRVVVQAPVEPPSTAHRPARLPVPVLFGDDGAARRPSSGPQAIEATTAAPCRAHAACALVVRTPAVATLAALFHDANAPPLRASSVTGRSA